MITHPKPLSLNHRVKLLTFQRLRVDLSSKGNQAPNLTSIAQKNLTVLCIRGLTPSAKECSRTVLINRRRQLWFTHLSLTNSQRQIKRRLPRTCNNYKIKKIRTDMPSLTITSSKNTLHRRQGNKRHSCLWFMKEMSCPQLLNPSKVPKSRSTGTFVTLANADFP